MTRSLISTVCCLLAFLSADSRAKWEPAIVPFEKHLPPGNVVWLRCFIRVPDNMVTPAEKDLWRDSITLSLGETRGPLALWLNGQKIGEARTPIGAERRRFKVPKGILEKKSFNALAIRVESSGLGLAPVLAGYFDELVLAGAWEMHAGEPEPATLRPLPAQPATAAFNETGFRPSTTPLSANPELMPGARLSPAGSLATMTAADDLAVDLVLSESLIAQPTHISFDERGRMWVAQYRQYPFPAGVKMISRDKYYRAQYDRVPPAPPYHDRGRDIISVHADSDGDGVFDTHRVVLEGLNMANAALRGYGGLWVMHTPYLLFYPDADGDDVPDRDPEVRLAGFGLEDTHSIANGLVWGPDGWLYGAQGSTTTSRVVRPGLDPSDFAGVYHESCMVWRYHPKTRVYEIFTEGGGNVFGLEFDSEGRLFSGHNGGDTRGFHYLQDGLFLKQGIDAGKIGPQGHPFAFGHLEMMKSRHPIPRFSHAIIVAEGTALPSRYAGRFFGADPMQRQIVVAERHPRGATFETSDAGVALAGADPAFRPVYLTNAPDGAIYVADFYEEFIAHGQNYQGQLDPSTGRIYRLRGRDVALEKDVDLAAKSSTQLVETLRHPNRWHRQTAVRLLAERRDPATIEPLRALLREPAGHPALEALWTLHQLETGDEGAALVHPAPSVRAWAVRLAKNVDLLELATTEPHIEVRAQLAATAQRLPAEKAVPLIAALLRRDEDATDPWLPMLCWWALEAHCTTQRDAVLAALPWEAAIVKQHILPRLMRRFAASEARVDFLTSARLLELAPSAEHRRMLMSGFDAAFAGRPLPALPDELVQALARHGLASRHLRVRLREPQAIAEALKIAADEQAKLDERLLCVRLFGEVSVPECVPVLLRLVTAEKATALRKAALTALLLYDAPTIGEEVARLYPELPADVQPAAQTLLTSRPAWCLTFLERRAVPPATLALLRDHAEPAVAALAQKLSPKSPAAPPHRAEIERLRTVLAAGVGDPYKGESIFLQRCAACHKLFHKGGRIGPDLTAYQRADLGTLLPSIVDPSAEIREGFANQLVTTTDGRSLSGFLVDQDTAVLVLRGPDGQDIHLPRSGVRELRAAPSSLMPESLLAGLGDEELRNFFAYLRIPQPITP